MLPITPSASRLTAVLAIAALVAPAGAAAQADHRTPDARDAAIHSQADRPGSFDLRSPDARDADSATPPTPRIPPAWNAAMHAQAERPGSVDLRSPDARDAATAGRPVHAVTAAPSTPATQLAHAPGFAWGDAAIGAGLVFLLIALSGVLLGAHRRRRITATPN